MSKVVTKNGVKHEVQVGVDGQRFHAHCKCGWHRSVKRWYAAENENRRHLIEVGRS